MALATYTDLLAAAASWLNRSDLTAQLPDFVALAEARIARDLRLRTQISTASLVTVAGVQSVSIPTDLLEIDNLTVTASGYERPMQVVTPEVLDTKFPVGQYSGVPVAYMISGDQFFFGPVPDAEYPISMRYFSRLPALAVTPTNWLLTKHPGIYLWATLAEAGPFMLDNERSAIFEGKYQADFEALRLSDERAVRGGSSMRVRPL